MKSLRNILFILAALVVIIPTADAQAKYKKKERKAHYNSQYNYEVEVQGVGQDGTKVIKVWGYGKKVEDAIIEAKMNAVAAAIFKGIPGGHGAAATPAIVSDPNANEKHADYFDNFFSPGGKYLQFIALTTDGMPSGQDRLKIKDGFKVAIYVQVMYDALRKQLEVDGVARRLDQGF